ncbi:MAG: type II secretion system minor pseudopilin GspI, partial [Pseudomonadota bacterium]
MPSRTLSPRDQGFTLVEVLVAMAVLAIALTAGLRLINQQTRFASALEDRVFAHWVAMNTMAERQLGLAEG